MKEKMFQLDGEERTRFTQRLTELLQGHDEIIFAFLYGSFVEGIPFHDIDVGVYLSTVRKEESTFCGLDLAHVLSKELQIPVDVRVLNFAPVSFLYHVIQGLLILERDEEIRSYFVEQTLKSYFDMMPMLKRGIKEAFGR
jgi:predicted nucleotidyltransferase